MTDAAPPCPSIDPAAVFVWLASQSPRRQELLRQIGIAFELLPPDADEDVEAPRLGILRVDQPATAEKSCFAHDASSFSSGRGATAGCNQ